MWPPTRDAFEEYWRAGLAAVAMDDVTRSYLRTIVEGSFLVAPLGRLGDPLRPLLAPPSRFMTLGFLPEELRHELGMPFSDAEQRLHRRVFATLGTVNRWMPGPLRRLPLNLYLHDTRRRLRRGRAVV